MLTIDEIRVLFRQEQVPGHILSMLEADPRRGVQQLLSRYREEMIRRQQERVRVLSMYRLELKHRDTELITAGVDEAGRGPLAGPVYAAAVILPAGLVLPGLNDSKKLDHRERAALREEIEARALAIGWGYATVREIDRHNILEATLLAMTRAYRSLGVQPDRVLVDGISLPDLPGTRLQAVVDGDRLSASIAAASILAKERRDRIMKYIDTVYPGYGFSSHMGYGTKSHYEALERLGPCLAHRKTFLRKWVTNGK